MHNSHSFRNALYHKSSTQMSAITQYAISDALTIVGFFDLS